MPPALAVLRPRPSATLLATLIFMLAPGPVLAQAATPAPKKSGEVAKAESFPAPHAAGEESIRQKYIREGGSPGASFIEQKAFLKAKGLIDPDDVGFVKVFQGEVTFSRNRKPETIKVTGTQPVLFLDFDETGFDSKIEMQFDDGSVLVMGENSGLKIDEMIFDPGTAKRKVSISVPVGTIRLKASKNTNPDSTFEIRTPLLVAGLRGTELIIQVDETGRTRVMTLEGAVAVRRHKPGEPRPAPKVGSAHLSPLGAAAANDVMVVASMMTEALPGRTDALRTRIARAEEIRAAIRSTVVRRTPAGIEKKADKALPAGPARQETAAGFAASPGNKEGSFGPPQSHAQSVRRAGEKANSENWNPAILSRGAVPVTLRGMTRLNAQKLSREIADGIRPPVSRMAGQETKSLAKETARETIKEFARSAARETGKAISRAVIQESVTSAVKETTVRSVREQATASAKEQAGNAVRQAAQEAASTAAKQTASQAAQEAASAAAKQAAVQAAQESGRQAAQEAASTAAKQTAAQAAQEAASAAAKEQANNAAQNAAKENSKNAAKENANNAAADQGKGKGK